MTTNLDKLSSAKKILLERRLRNAPIRSDRDGSDLAALGAFVRPEGAVPPSPTQARYLQLGRESLAATQHGCLLRLRGTLDIERFCASIQAIFDHHEILRTRYPEHDGIAVQEVLAPKPLGLMLETFIGDDPDAAWEELQELGRECQSEPIDPQTMVPCCLRLFRLNENDHVVLWIASHLLYDDWSTRLLFRELFAHYLGHGVPHVRIQHRDYTAWSHQFLESRHGENLGIFWKNYLAGVSPKLLIPFDQVSDSWPHQAASLKSGLDKELTARLIEIATSEHSTLFVMVLDALAHTLADWTGQTDIIVGTTVADRSDPSMARIMGPLINWLPIRLRLDPAAIGCASRVLTHRSVFQALAHQRFPFGKMEFSGREPSDSAVPKSYNVKLTVRSAHSRMDIGSGLYCEIFNVKELCTRYDLEFFLDLPANPAQDGSGLRCTYNADSLFPATIQGLLEKTKAQLLVAAGLSCRFEEGVLS